MNASRLRETFPRLAAQWIRCAPCAATREPRSRYPEILQGPERTDVKGAHVTHFYPKNIITDHPIWSRPLKISSKSSKSTRTADTERRGGARGSASISFAEPCKCSLGSSASVKMGLANDWKTARRNGSGR